MAHELAQGRREIRALTGLRIVAALWVVLIHFQTVIVDSWGAYAAPFRPIIMSGWLGVDLFFLLSGFVLTYSYVDRIGARWDHRQVLDFVWARLIRIWPLWALLTVTAASFLLLSGWDQASGVYPREVTWASLLEQLALVQMWTRELNLGSSFVAPGWSLSVEILAYLAFPVLVLVAHRCRRLPVVVLGGLAVGALLPMAVFALRTGTADFWLPWQLRIAGAFVSGIFTCLVVLRLRSSSRVRRLAPLVALAAVMEIGLVTVWSDARVVAGDGNRLGFVVVAFPVLVGALALSDRGLAAVLSRESMVIGGRISFALYLVHCLVLDVFRWSQTELDLLAQGRPVATLVEANLIPVSLAVSWCLWRFVEEPARAWLRARRPGRRGREVSAVSRLAGVPRSGPRLRADHVPSPFPVRHTADTVEVETLVARRELPRVAPAHGRSLVPDHPTRSRSVVSRT